MFTNLDNAKAAELGRIGEEVAAIYLTKCLGWSVIDRNVRTRWGEIDLVAMDGCTYVFVEVKIRRPSMFGTALDAITDGKIARLMQQIEYYLQRNHLISDEISVRLDAIAIAWFDGLVQSIQHVKVN